MKNCTHTFLRLLMMVMALVGVHAAQAALTINNDGTVTDPTTGLTWMRCSMGQTWDGSTCSGTANTYTFWQAKALTVTFAGQSDWRMPNLSELGTIVVRYHSPAIDTTAFPNTPGSIFWTSSSLSSSSSYAWGIDFSYTGSSDFNYSQYSYYAARLVRGGAYVGPIVLTVSKGGTGGGTVKSSTGDIDCGNTCSKTFNSGTSVTLTATPSTGSTFTGWSGACTGTGSCTVSMTVAQSVRATFTQSTTAPVCTLSANPPTINAGSSATLTATCNPTATSYVWTGGTCAGNTGATCTVTPSAATTYTVTGVNAVGTGNTASATVSIVSIVSSTVPGTQGNDFFLPSGNNSYYGGAGNDTYIISPYTLSGAVTAKIIDTEGANVIQLVGGVTIASSSFFMDAAQLMLSNGAIVQVLGASKFIYQLGVDILAGETASNLSYAQFAAALGASVPAAGASAVSGTANFVVTKQ